MLWIGVAPGGLEETGRQLSRHPQVRFVSAIEVTPLLTGVKRTGPVRPGSL
ncbi:hypothetical protein [Streptomyces monashensis]|uniref:hypothetical protein n=1 Tax=Streptomyces monashensis TaxID=1678012 RepID=UPI000AABB92D|nr:hypothetical protein [Streptomyces monashensis]